MLDLQGSGDAAIGSRRKIATKTKMITVVIQIVTMKRKRPKIRWRLVVCGSFKTKISKYNSLFICN